MIVKFLIERRSWILLFLFLQILTLSVTFLDTTIPFTSMFYLVFLSLIIFTIFLIVRYNKETKFYQSLEEWENDLDVTKIIESETPFERIMEKSITHQTELLMKKASRNQQLLAQEKDDLLAWIHEVKTPLTAMHLMIDRLEDETLKSQMTYEWMRIHLLLDQQLHQKRIPFMENDLFIETTELKLLITTEIKMLQSWCIRKGIGFEVELEATEVLSDAKWLAFIIRQLLSNAVKYSEASDIVIRSYKQNSKTLLEIEDSGRGINQRDLPRIFEKGFTSTTHHQDHAGTGMGLYLAQKAAHPLLIQIDVHSTFGDGTTFTLTFPQRNDFVKILGM
jgi:two-component system, OmpR family, bacitracin resistance sensor histidine kinase BceS